MGFISFFMKLLCGATPKEQINTKRFDGDGGTDFHRLKRIPMDTAKEK